MISMIFVYKDSKKDIDGYSISTKSQNNEKIDHLYNIELERNKSSNSLILIFQPLSM